MNSNLIAEFEKLVKQIKFEIGNNPSKKESITYRFKLKNIANTLEIIKRFKTEITNSDQLKGIKGVGKGSLNRIDEILTTGKLSEIVIDEENDKLISIMTELETIIGIGKTISYDLVYNKNVRSIDDLVNKYENGEIELNHQIIMGLKYKDILLEKIPRQVVTDVKNYLTDVIFKYNNLIKMYVCGSYRRKLPFSGDIDILIVHPKIITREQLENSKNHLIAIVDILKKDNFIIDDITNQDYTVVYRGFCKYDDNIMRLDLKYVPAESEFYSLVYYTGGQLTNISLRKLAVHLGYKLSEYALTGLYDNKSVKCDSERCVYEALNLEYVEPEFR